MSLPTRVQLWGRTIGAVVRPEGERFAHFEYDPDFAGSGIEVAPLTMPLSRRIWRFPRLDPRTFHGLPGLLADSLPDRFGHALIDAWLATRGRTPESFDAIARLGYIGQRGMGALCFEPATGPDPFSDRVLEVAALVGLANRVLSARRDLNVAMPPDDPGAGLQEILRVGTSAGGARAKALVAWNPDTGEARSGQVETGSGFGYWLLKFDGIHDNRDRELADPQGFGVVEYVYHLMARAAGIEMTDCRLLDEGGRRHFITRRFDRTPSGGRLHMQSLGALAHLDYNQPGAHGYEQALLALRRLHLPMDDIEALYRRMVFNVVARNQDDHVKNIALLMDRQGRWSLAPAFDLTWAWNPDGAWTARHQMSVNGKGDGFTVDDLRAVADVAAMKRGRAEAILAEVVDAVRQWPALAEEHGVAGGWVAAVAGSHRLHWPGCGGL